LSRIGVIVAFDGRHEGVTSNAEALETIRQQIDALYETRIEGTFTIAELTRYVDLVERERALVRARASSAASRCRAGRARR
jgi:hypothetical protein